jgi:hypothetical protein
MKNCNLFSVLGVILVLAFVFTGSAMADPDEKKRKENGSELDINSDEKKKKKNGSKLDIETLPLSDHFFILPIEDIENLTIEEDNYRLKIGAAPANPAALSRVQVSQLRSNRSSAGTVVFTWMTKSETENAGFIVNPVINYTLL